VVTLTFSVVPTSTLCSKYGMQCLQLLPRKTLHTSVIQHDSGHLLNYSILSFHNPILLRCLGCRKFLLCSLIVAKVLEFRVLKLSSMITLDPNNQSILLYLQLLAQMNHLVRSFRFIFTRTIQVYCVKSSTRIRMYFISPKL